MLWTGYKRKIWSTWTLAQVSLRSLPRTTCYPSVWFSDVQSYHPQSETARHVEH